MRTFDRKYFCWTLVLFVVEVLIALYVRDSFVRPYVGDYLVTILVYCGLRTFIKAPAWKVALGALLFAYLVETLQYFHIVRLLGLEHNVVARTVIGYGFEWADFVAYTLGILTVLLLERKGLRPGKRGYA